MQIPIIQISITFFWLIKIKCIRIGHIISKHDADDPKIGRNSRFSGITDDVEHTIFGRKIQISGPFFTPKTPLMAALRMCVTALRLVASVTVTNFACFSLKHHIQANGLRGARFTCNVVSARRAGSTGRNTAVSRCLPDWVSNI